MITVYQGGASIDERGKAYGGQAGNQTGAELRKRVWYVHSKGWYILRAKRADVRAAIAEAMDRAWPNKKIGYDQWQRYTLWNQVKIKEYDPGLATIACECDCSTLVATCVQYAFEKCGIDYVVPVDGFRTPNEVSRLMATGQFELLSSDMYCARKDGAYNMRGDIACTRVQGHTIAVLTNGEYAEEEDTTPATPNTAQSVIRKGDRGEAVKTAQKLLILWNSKALPKYGADSDFGDETDEWVRAFQSAHKLEADGVVGPKTWTALGQYAVVDNGDEHDDGVDSEQTETPAVDLSLRPTLSKGDSGAYVELMQKKLIAWNSAALPEWHADSDFGTETLKWVKKFQTAMGIGVDGIVGKKTWGKLDMY